MCGIFGYVGTRNAVKPTIDGLKKLAYRGYDSAGIALIENNAISYCKEVGNVEVMEKKVAEMQIAGNIAISQTRWATHGRPTRINAHPHFNEDHSLALVHNGIIENHTALRKLLEEKGVVFLSDTDTEVIAHLISMFYKKDIVEALQQAVLLLKGSFAIALLHKDFPDQILLSAHESPLAIGTGKGETFISSDPQAFGKSVGEAIFLEGREIAIIKKDSNEIFDQNRVRLDNKIRILVNQAEEVTKGLYEHYTLKEIFEQPQTLKAAMLSRLIDEYGTAHFDEINVDDFHFPSIERVVILACGTSWHAAYAAQYMLEEKARLPTQVEISSEYRYKNPIILPGTLAIVISQSGETADSLAAMRELKAKGVKVLAICNVQGSSIAREADGCILLRAGPEIGVCSTKAFTSQMTILSLFTLFLARQRHMKKEEGVAFLQHLREIPEKVQQVLEQKDHIRKIAEKYAHFENFFFIGRKYMFPTALEGALKLKEISYINANGYPAGEMKHGSIALINENCPTVALLANHATYDKVLSNMMEIKARNGSIIAIATKGSDGVEAIADDIIWVPQTPDELIIPTAVVTQVFAYYTAKKRGADIDQPRNLAKAVTVE